LNQPEVYPPREGGQVLNFEMLVLIWLRFFGYIAYFSIELLEKTLGTFFLTPQLNPPQINKRIEKV